VHVDSDKGGADKKEGTDMNNYPPGVTGFEPQINPPGPKKHPKTPTGVMKALSIRQPWAWAIIHAGKDVENRTWHTNVRGRVLIHASKKFDMEGYKILKQTFRIHGEHIPSSISNFPRGGIIGSVTITDCVSSHPSFWFFGPYGFVLSDPQAMEFRSCPGSLGFFEVKS
jgi:hypothetical protein